MYVAIGIAILLFVIVIKLYNSILVKRNSHQSKADWDKQKDMMDAELAESGVPQSDHFRMKLKWIKESTHGMSLKDAIAWEMDHIDDEAPTTTMQAGGQEASSSPRPLDEAELGRRLKNAKEMGLVGEAAGMYVISLMTDSEKIEANRIMAEIHNRK